MQGENQTRYNLMDTATRELSYFMFPFMSSICICLWFRCKVGLCALKGDFWRVKVLACCSSHGKYGLVSGPSEVNSDIQELKNMIRHLNCHMEGVVDAIN